MRWTQRHFYDVFDKNASSEFKYEGTADDGHATEQLTCLKNKTKQKILRTCPGLGDTKETQQPKVTCNPGLDPVPEKGHRSYTVCRSINRIAAMLIS